MSTWIGGQGTAKPTSPHEAGNLAGGVLLLQKLDLAAPANRDVLAFSSGAV